MSDAAQLQMLVRCMEARLHNLRWRLAASHPKLARGRVWCRICGDSYLVDPLRAIRVGWPKCCGATMTIDAPEERGE